jgi:hypothetical protein
MTNNSRACAMRLNLPYRRIRQLMLVLPPRRGWAAMVALPPPPGPWPTLLPPEVLLVASRVLRGQQVRNLIRRVRRVRQTCRLVRPRR